MDSRLHTIYYEETDTQSFMTKVYGWMFLALCLTGLIAMQIAANPSITGVIEGNPGMLMGLALLQLLLVVALSFAISKISAAIALVMFFVYSALNGVLFSMIFLVYTPVSIATTFMATASMFGVMSAYGYFTKKDLSSWGSMLFMALIGLIIASVINMFWANNMLYWLVTYAGILIFVGLTAYDTQKIKRMAQGTSGDDEAGKKSAIIGALVLYLDFINLFLLLLRLLGNRRD
jgi:uncharacterized protein